MVDFVAIQNQQALAAGATLDGLKPGGVIYLQSTLPADKTWASLPAGFRHTIRERKLRLFTLDAAKIARESSQPGMRSLQGAPSLDGIGNRRRDRPKAA